MKIILLLSFSFFVLISIQNAAQVKESGQSPDNINSVPSKISYQGVLTDNNGVPQNGTYTMDFKLFPTQSGGTAVWSETQQNVPVTDGIFNVYLGENNPLNNLAFDVPYWLEVTVSGTVLPRIELSSSAYSFNTSRIQGNEVSSTAPENGEVLKWDGTQWFPGLDEVGGFDLPYNGTYNGNDPALQIENPTMGLKARFLTESDNILQLCPSGSTTWAPSGLLDIQNAFSGKTALNINNQSGSGFGLYIWSYPGGGPPLEIDNDGDFDAVNIDNGNNGGRGLVINNGNNGEVALWVNNVSSNYAGYFEGDVNVTGTITQGGNLFQIDDPRDPGNKILRHSAVESPDMMNVYNGNVTTDGIGNATVQLPDYFSALNKDFKYQLTVIGQFAQAIVSQEIQGNHFSIKTDKPNIKVSWQITGVRKDPWAKKHRIVVEEEKTNDTRGYYLNPDAYGLPASRSISLIKHHNSLKKVK